MDVRRYQNFSFWDHLDQFRYCLSGIFLTWAVAAAAAFLFSDKIILFISKSTGQLVFLSPAEALTVRVQLSVSLGILLAFPIWACQIISFVWTGLKRHEQRLIWVFSLSFFLMSLTGVLFAVHVLVPAFLRILMSFSSPALRPMISAQNYINFYLGILSGSCLLFNLPLVMMALAWLKIVSARQFSSSRRIVFLGCMAVGALMTPPDVISQIVMGLPLYLLYEFGLLMIKLFQSEEKGRD
ncbi:MAG: twin-arginine translocase subunit TatC [Candidatus Omnitrophota bacterium]